MRILLRLFIICFSASASFCYVKALSFVPALDFLHIAIYMAGFIISLCLATYFAIKLGET